MTVSFHNAENCVVGLLSLVAAALLPSTHIQTHRQNSYHKRDNQLCNWRSVRLKFHSVRFAKMEMPEMRFNFTQTNVKGDINVAFLVFMRMTLTNYRILLHCSRGRASTIK